MGKWEDGRPAGPPYSAENVRLARLGVAEPFRNGKLDATYAESRERTMRYTIEPKSG